MCTTIRNSLLAAGVTALALSAGAQAQDYSLPPNYGQVSLSSGFSPDPHSVQLDAGGSIDIENQYSHCRGYIAQAPDYRLHYTAGSFPLYINVDSNADTTLVVNGPGGQWHCDDDGASAGLNPLLEFSNPQSGQYDIWVGTYSSGGLEPATLFISELGEQTAGGGGGGSQAANVNIGASPRHGNVSLTSGFVPDPWTRTVTAGGSLDAGSALPISCAGYITSEPTVEFDFNGSGELHIFTTGGADTTLAINRPDGTWECNDDGANGTNAGLSFYGNSGGIYDIYVGRFSQGREQTTLNISELGMGGGGGAGGGATGVDISAPATHGDYTLNMGFMPDPWTRPVTARGGVDASSAVPGNCSGYIPSAPSVQLDFNGSGELHIYTEGNTDTVLVINKPDGSWECNDDGANGTNAGLSFHGNTGGIYDIFVGTFSGSSGQTTLKVSEIALGH